MEGTSQIGWTARVCVTLCLLPALVAAQKTPTLDELLAGHMAAIGPTSLRQAITNRVVEGQLTVESRLTNASWDPAAAHLITQGHRYRISFPFPPSDYVAWDVAYGGPGFSVETRSVSQSLVAPFVRSCGEAWKEGLFGGTLSASWPLLDVKSNKARLTPVKRWKLDGKRLWRVDYRTAAVEAHLYFEPDTFRHVRTFYHGCADWNTVLEERFETFISATGLTLPGRWILVFMPRGHTNDSRWVRWKFTIHRIRHNAVFQPDVFTLGGPVPLLKTEGAQLP